MERTILDTIKQVRGNLPFLISENNQNIYRVLLNEPDGGKTAYYFNSPLYRRRDGNLIRKCFVQNGDVQAFEGSTAKITYQNGEFCMADHSGSLFVCFERGNLELTERGTLYSRDLHIEPTLNGIVVKAACVGNTPFEFSIRTTEIFSNIKKNSKYLAFMRNKFEPFFVISSLYAHADATNGFVPCTVAAEAETDGTYTVTIQSTTSETNSVLFEINLYEGKFFQDTTVESGAPDRNNCYGSSSFLGQTDELGEQWLYTKTSRKKVFDIENRPIQSVRMFIPVFKKGVFLPTAYLPLERFCSFGSTWKKKIPFTDLLTTAEFAQYNEQFYILDLSKLLIDPTTHFLRRTEGFVLRLANAGEDYSVIATGDCCKAPQFLEIRYR